MGTVFSLDIRAPGCLPSAVDDVIAWLHWVDSTFSTYRPESPISRLARGEITLENCPSEVAEVLARCAEIQVETDGYFSAYANGQLDPSGLVKGWAIARASAMLSAAGSVNHCVNGGGDVHCAGSTGGGQPWRIGISDPLRLRELGGIVVGTNLAVATSGTAERGAHIVDPHTRALVTGPLASVTLIGSDVATVDAYATAAFAMGDDAADWVSGLDGYHGLIVGMDGSQWVSPGFARR